MYEWRDSLRDSRYGFNCSGTFVSGVEVLEKIFDTRNFFMASYVFIIVPPDNVLSIILIGFFSKNSLEGTRPYAPGIFCENILALSFVRILPPNID